MWLNANIVPYTMPKTYDIAVLGGTAAGYVAAAALAKKGHSVIVLSSSANAGDVESPLADWIPAGVFSACPILRQVKSSVVDSPFRAVHFHSADLTRQAVCRSRTTLGFTLLRPRLIKTLASATRQVGVRCIRLKKTPQISLRETTVVLSEKTSPTREIRANVLMIAEGEPSEVMSRLAIPARDAPDGRITICELTVRLRPSDRNSIDKALHVVALAGANQFGMFFTAGGGLHVRIVYLAGSGSHGAEELVRFIRNLQQADALPERLNLSKATAAVWHPPGGVALEMETHIAKRTLLIGTAGGFASAMTGATLDPSIHSAMAAADVADRALRSNRLQETLADFKDQWRDTLAGRIRPPETSLQMMLPMALTNKTMTARFAKAFLHGENI